METDVQVPGSWSKKKRAAALEGSIRPTGKPDCSNMVKLVEDALNGVAWRDDSQIVSLGVRKRYAEKPETRLTIKEVV